MTKVAPARTRLSCLRVRVKDDVDEAMEVEEAISSGEVDSVEEADVFPFCKSDVCV